MGIVIVFLTLDIVRAYGVYEFINAFLKKKRTPVWVIVGAYVPYILLGNYIYFHIYNPTLNIVFNLLYCFFIGFLYKTTIFKQLLATIFIYILSIASEDCSATAVSLFFHTTFEEAIKQTNYVIIGIILSNALMLGLVKWIKVFLWKQETYYKELQNSYWFAIFLVPTGSIYVLNSLTSEINSGQDERLYLLESAILIVIFINILVFYLYDKLQMEENIKYENILLSQQNEAYEKQSALIKSYQKDMGECRHNINNHLVALLGLAEQGQISDLLEYIKKLMVPIQKNESGIHTNDTVIDAIINSKLYIASKQNIQMDLHIQMAEALQINKMDLTILLGNLLDNALEACHKLPIHHREIQVNISAQHGVLTIKIINTYDASQICIRKGKLYSTKKNKNLHGIGLHSVIHTIEKYNGIFEYQCSQSDDKEKHLFTVQAMLYLL